MRTHSLCFRAKIRKLAYPFTYQFYYIKVGCPRFFISRTCLHDVVIFFAFFKLRFSFDIIQLLTIEALDMM